MPDKKVLPMTKDSDPHHEIGKLRKKIHGSKEPDPKDVERLRRLIGTASGVSSKYAATQFLRHQLVGKISESVSHAYLLAEEDQLKKELEYANAPTLERLLIDHILMVRLRLFNVEGAYTKTIVNKTASIKVGVYLDNLLSTNQNRFLRAIESLARVRRLTRNTPSLQINIAREGGQQVNVQTGMGERSYNDE